MPFQFGTSYLFHGDGVHGPFSAPWRVDLSLKEANRDGYLLVRGVPKGRDTGVVDGWYFRNKLVPDNQVPAHYRAKALILI